MATNAGWNRVLKNAAGVATIATHILVGAIEFKSRGVVIKWLLRKGRCGEEQGDQQNSGFDSHRIL